MLFERTLTGLSKTVTVFSVTPSWGLGSVLGSVREVSRRY